MEKEKQNFYTNFFDLIPPKTKKIFNCAITVCGINGFGLMGIFGYICSNKNFFLDYFEFFIITIIIVISLIIVSFIVISITLCTLLLRLKPFIEGYDNNLEDCKENCNNIKQYIEKEKSHLSELINGTICIEKTLNGFAENLDRFDKIITELEIAGNIINKNKLMEIEKSVPSNSDIVILSSKYKLDEEFMPLIINNIKKGVTYKYIVTGANLSSPNHVRFTKIVRTWHKRYFESFSMEKHGVFPQVSSKKTNKKSIINDNKYFYDHVKEYNSPLAYDILTIMLYQKGNSEDYHVIINLPSEKEGYYSYILPDNHSVKQSIIDGIIYMCNKEREHNYRGEDYAK